MGIHPHLNPPPQGGGDIFRKILEAPTFGRRDSLRRALNSLHVNEVRIMKSVLWFQGFRPGHIDRHQDLHWEKCNFRSLRFTDAVGLLRI
jgi:hypothetical protein